MSTIFFTKSMFATSESRGELEPLRRSGARIGLLVNGNGHQPQLLEKTSVGRTLLPDDVDRDLVIYTDTFTDEVLTEAAAKARRKGQALFVGEHRQDRGAALKAGFDAAIPHASLVPEIMGGQTLVYARVSGLNGDYRDGRVARLLDLPAVPFHVTSEENRSAYLITSTRIADLLSRMGFNITTFDEEHDPQTTDLYLVRDDRRIPEAMDRVAFSMDFLRKEGKANFVVSPVRDALLVALPPRMPIEEIHFPKPLHGHNLRLLPDRALLKNLGPNSSGLTDAAVRPSSRLTPLAGGLTKDELDALKDGITAKRIEDFHSPYIGKTPLTVGGTTHTIRSRHISHTQNKLVTTALEEQLNSVGSGLLTLTPHEFDVGGGTKLINVVADLPGTDLNSVIIISAHLDSTARDVSGFYPAPGGDDDASGMAGVLAAVEVAVKLRHKVGPFKRTLRFVFFNAEEDGIFGSWMYVQQLPANIDIAAVFQMDMIGFHGGKPTVFEIHAGANDGDIQAMSRPLAEMVRDVARLVSPSLVNDYSPQMYPLEGRFDPAAERSDHRRFHEYGHPACMISEDHFFDEGDPTPDPQYNPNYHESDDLDIDYAYAAEIARAVAGAAILMAKS